jgi:hypothetical protein
VKKRFQSLPFKCNLQRYTSGLGSVASRGVGNVALGMLSRAEVGL